MKRLLAGLFVAGALFVGFAPSGGRASTGVDARAVSNPGGRVPNTGESPQQMTCGTITCAAYEAGVNGFLQNVAADSGGPNNVFSVLTQYSGLAGKIAYNEKFGGSYVDVRPYPANGCSTPAAKICLTKTQLDLELYEAATADAGWTMGDRKLFVILLPEGVDTCYVADASKGCASNRAFCAYHDVGMAGYDHHMIWAVEPFSTEWGCGVDYQGFPNGQEIDETVNTLSHEELESITDPGVLNPPDLNYGWYSSDGDEISDLCAWSFGTPLGTTAGGQPYNQVINGHFYDLQQAYSNADGGCVQRLGGIASGTTNGAGPLVYHNGLVMPSVTVYTVYWIPILYDPTVNTAVPTLTGTAAVGKYLHSTRGTWTNGAKTYRFRWQRCDSAGAKCVTIPSGAGASYKVLAADAGHTIRSGVWALNGHGWAPGGYAWSLPSAVVVGIPTVISKPVISGTTTIGTTLSVSTGSWRYSPTSYAYHWQRCSAAGLSCVAITGATKSAYKLTAGDGGHTLKVKVTAKNAAGSSRTVVTAKSAVVTK